jgi:hypothetical protein
MFITTAFIGISNASSTYAVVIDFDDLVPVYDPVSPCFCDNPLTNQYESQGLLIDNAYLNGDSTDGGLTYENILLSGPYTALYFVGQLPTFVSMNVTSSNGDAIFLTAYGPGGGAGEYQTAGFAGSDDDPPVIPNEFVSFHSEAGISQINIDSYYFLRVSAAIDNLTFTYSAVPEPSPLILMLLGCVAVFWRRISIK